MHTRLQDIKKTCMCHFDPLRRSRRFKFPAVLALSGGLVSSVQEGLAVFGVKSLYPSPKISTQLSEG